MDQLRRQSGRNSPAIIGTVTDEELLEEDCELDGSDERELFLRKDYIQVLDKTQRPNSQASDDRSSRNHLNSVDMEIIDMTTNETKFEPLTVEEPGNIAITTRSVMYQSPSFHRFAGELGPSSSSSIVTSSIMITVIICVTFLPIIIPFPYTSMQNTVINADGNHRISNETIKHADVRCKCICRIPLDPSKAAKGPKATNKTDKPTAQRSLYVGSSAPQQCNCRNIVRPHLNLTLINLEQFCSGCECRFQSRNLSTIKRNVVFFIAVLTNLCLYMLIQYIIKFMRLNRRAMPRRLRWLVHQQTNESI